MLKNTKLNLSVKVTQGSAEKYKTKLVCECHLIAVLKMVKVISLFVILDVKMENCRSLIYCGWLDN